MLTEQQKERLKRRRDDFAYYAKHCLIIRPKDGKTQHFELNKAQKYIHACVETQRKEHGKVRVIILKGRQQGCSTYIEGRFYWRVTHSKGVRAFILTHEDDATNNLFEIANRYHENCPSYAKPHTGAANAKELSFDILDSGYKLGTAGNKSTGRSSTIQFLHASEAAFYKHASEHAKGILQTVPNMPNTEIFVESTANGVGNWFHQLWQKAEVGESEFIPIFVPWYWQDEYILTPKDDFKPTDDELLLKEIYNITDSQLMWRRVKIDEMSVNGIDGTKFFKQEYPFNATEAFQTSGEESFIQPELVMIGRNENKYNRIEKVGAKLLGVDVARFGTDRSTLIRRHGRVAYGLEVYEKVDTMHLTGVIHNIIEREKIDFIFVDVIGIGSGVVDRLKELGHNDKIIPVNSAEKALKMDKYSNKRAEIWAELKIWLQDYPVQLPDDNALHADLCGPTFKFDSKGRTVIESKDEMKKRGIRSSDCADCLAHTFARPVTALISRRTSDAEAAKLIMSQFTQVSRIKSTRYQKR